MEPPRGIYEAVRKETLEILQALEQPAQNPELSNAIDSAKENFRQLMVETDETLQKLDKDVEWDDFTVALYGETNAGKSTIIETLRILMGERSKLEQQQKFRETRERFRIGTNVVEEWEQKSRDLAGGMIDLRNLDLKFADARKLQTARELELVARTEQLAAEISTMPYWRRVLSFVWKIPLKSVLISVNAELQAVASEMRRLSEQYEEERSTILERIDSTKKDMARIDEAKNELAAYEDGLIIGDGQSDFTRESRRYEFEANNNKFVLLDVPGIEGKEELVREPIMQAVRKAHAVFYVTRKAVPPQKGDDETGGKGTLEKIKEHLGAQTEVWTIFNKGIKSPEQLRAQRLVNKGECDGLDVLEEEMRRQLGEQYAGWLPVSAYAAFVASTEHFVPGSAKSKDRNKFLATLDAASVLRKTGFHDLIAKLTIEMAENSRLKIRKSNFNKANEAVIQLKSRVDLLNKKRFSPLFKRLEDEAHASSRQLNSVADACMGKLETDGGDLINRARGQVRETIYNRIDDGLGKNEFKAALRCYLDLRGEKLQEEMLEVVNNILGEFLKEVEGIAEQFQEHVQGFLDDASTIGSMDLDLKIDIDRGIKVGGLVSVAIGAVALWWNPVGWVIGAIGVVGLLWTFIKSMWALVSDDFKKSQQRKNADENIFRVFGSVMDKYTEQLRENSKKLQEKLRDIHNGFRLPASQAEQIIVSLAASSRRLASISRNIKKEGGL